MPVSFGGEEMFASRPDSFRRRQTYLSRYSFFRPLESSDGLRIFTCKVKKRMAMEYKLDEKALAGTCLECGAALPYGRQDRKFCCSKCKNDYNNRRVRVSRATHRRVQGALEKNYELLARLCRARISSLMLSEAIMLGFNPEYATGHRRIGGREEYSCFEIKYCLSANRIYNITNQSKII